MKTYTTSQVVRLLELHPDWEFIAPETRDLFACAADCDGMHIGFAAECHGSILRDAPIRSDWTRVKPVKKKREWVKVGGVRVLGDLVSLDNHKSFRELGDGTWTLYAVENA